MLGELNKADAAERPPLARALVASGALIGLLQQPAEAWLQGENAASGEIETLIAKRNEARRTRDFAEADRIRARPWRSAVSCSRTGRAAPPGGGRVRRCVSRCIVIPAGAKRRAGIQESRPWMPAFAGMTT